MMRLGVIVAILTALVVTACGGEDGVETFEHEGFPFTFEYPGDMERDEGPDFEFELGQAAEDSVALGLDEENAIILQRFELATEIDEDNLDLAKEELDGLLRRIDPDAADGEEDEVAGFPSLTYESVSLPSPEEGESDYVALFNDAEQYMINCQSTPDNRDEIESACDQVRGTLEAE